MYLNCSFASDKGAFKYYISKSGGSLTEIAYIVHAVGSSGAWYGAGSTVNLPDNPGMGCQAW